jgi:3-isopropylmalate/(R)-2-methylmalate dehydratase small subunit
MNKIKGRVWKYGDDVNTDVIFPGKYTYTISDPKEMPQHALEDLDPSFSDMVKPGDIIVGGRNWGCGSSREQAVTCLKESQLGGIIAISFARIYYRNCLNAALPALICPDVGEAVQNGDVLEIDLSAGVILSSDRSYTFAPFPDVVKKIINAGGLIQYTRAQLSATGD